MPLNRKHQKLLDAALNGSEEDRRAAIEKLVDLRVDQLTNPTQKFYVSYADPANPVCFVCGRAEHEMSEEAAWQGTMMASGPIGARRKLCADCGADAPRPCTKCGAIARIMLSCADAELCRQCYRDL